MTSTWFITGTSTGFGRELTEQLLRRGDTVAATLRTPSRLGDLAAEHGDRLWRRALDVTDTAAVRRVVDEAFAELGRVDVVISNAGIGVFGAAEEMTDDQIQQQIATNVLGSVQLARAVTPHFRAQGGGRLLQVSSMGGQVAFPGLSVYHLTKWAIEGFFEAYAQEVERFGIRTTLIEPGMAGTSFYGGGEPPRAPALDVYEGTELTPWLRGTGVSENDMPGDLRKMAEAMIRIAESDDPPRRQLLGSDAYAMVREALTERVRALDDQRALALSTDRDAHRSGHAGR
ncbi:SDR family oxidoreductase [Actinoallomurus purpureus]|uniref:SDR family oxidoreductase n=1 Tax=Actinoallomurus purpureus TaxID=478114 RepID=UPI0020939526|nr:SDR family oxidoreductase [Actinoallomurus purpureus]MCO6011144.1 SDR family oxidoreductase [Actinoallomurus purpureus]